MRRIFFITLILMPASLFALLDRVEGQNPSGDMQVWNTQFYNQKISDKCSICFSSQERFADGVTKLNLIYAELFAFNEWKKWLTLGVGYRSQWVLTNEQRLVAAYVFLFDGIYKKDFSGWKFSDRNRAQFLTFQKGKALWLYRNKPSLVAPWRIGTMGLQPYIANEFFILESAGFFENRFEVGGQLEFTSHSGSAIYYMNRYIKLVNRWRLNQIIGINLNLKF